jgi:hypothetical protein
MQEHVSSETSQAVFDTLLYSDVFDFPLTVDEIHKYLTGRAAAYEEIQHVLNSDPRFSKVGTYFTLSGREEIVHLREERELRSQKLLPHALNYGRIMASLPFVRMVTLTGSLAVKNVSGDEDFDYMVVTQPGRLWTARAFILLFNRLTRRAGHAICPNVLVSENSLVWSQHDLYSARDFCQMIPISGMTVYKKLIESNQWVRDFLPNAYEELMRIPQAQAKNQIRILQRTLEFPLRGRLGDRIERWEMHRKIMRFSKQEGFGEETIFNADICQGNFDHHRKWTQQQLRKRGRTIEVEASFHQGKVA